MESALRSDQVFGGPMLKRLPGSASGPLQAQPAAGAATAPATTGARTGQLAADALFDEMFARYQGPIYGYILGMVGNPEQAQDLTQDTFVKAYKALPTTRDLVLPAWLYRIATNTCYDALRRRRLISWLPWGRRGDDDGESETWQPEPVGDDGDLAGRYAVGEGVREALRGVPAALRAPLLLHVVHGFGYADIAVTLGISEAAVKMRVSRARAAFKAAYNRDGEADEQGLAEADR